MGLLKNHLKKIYYSGLELMTGDRGVQKRINGFALRLPAKYSRYFPSIYEPEDFEFFEKNARPGMVSLDIGAHFGLWSVFMHKKTNGKVFAFEPTPSTCAVFRQVMHMNKCQENVELLAMAVDAHPGKASFYVMETPGAVGNSLVDYQPEAHAQQPIEIEIISIDSFVRERNIHPGFIKIDAEGAELGVLKGGENFIRKYKPLVVLNIHPESISKRGDSMQQIWDLCLDLGYYMTCGHQRLSEQEFCRKENIFDVQLTPG